MTRSLKTGIELPLLGLPLAGKTTVLAHAALAFGSPIERRIYEVEVPGPFHGVATAILSASIRVGGHDVFMWCMPGGCDDNWTLPLLPRPSPAVFVLDSQAEVQDRQNEWWRVHATQVRVTDSIAILTKTDLASSQTSASVLPRELINCPHIRASGMSLSGQARIQEFLGAQISSFPPSPAAGRVSEIDVVDTSSPAPYLRLHPTDPD